MTLTAKQLKQLREARVSPAGNKVQLAIDLAGETQSSVARAIGMPNTSVSDLARGRYETLTVANAHKFAGFFGCAIEDLFPDREAVAS